MNSYIDFYNLFVPTYTPSPQTVSDGAVCLDKIQFLEEKSGFVCLKYVVTGNQEYIKIGNNRTSKTVTMVQHRKHY